MESNDEKLSLFSAKEREFLEANPDQIPSVDDTLYHFSPDRIESFNNETSGSMYFVVNNDPTGLNGKNSRFVHTVQVIKDFTLENFTTYLGYHKELGWGVRLNEDKTAVMWISISNQLLNEYLAVEDVAESESYYDNSDKKSKVVPRKVKQRVATVYLDKLMSPKTLPDELQHDEKSIYQIVAQLMNGEIDSNYDTDAIKTMFSKLKWKFPLDE